MTNVSIISTSIGSHENSKNGIQSLITYSILRIDETVLIIGIYNQLSKICKK